ncbi:MAG: hypothetical protein RR482_06885 [Clostridia bacterium]
MKKAFVWFTCCVFALLLMMGTALAEPIAVESLTDTGTLHENDDNLTLTYELRLPKLRDERADTINQSAADWLTYYKNSYIPMVYAENRAAWSEKDIPIEITVDYTIKRNDGDIVSILYCVSLSKGDAPEETYFAETYRLSDGKRLMLSDFTQLQEPTLSVVTREVKRQIQAQPAGEGAWQYQENLDENTLAMYLAEDTFYLAEDGHVVLFVNPSFITNSQAGLCEFPVENAVLGK